MLNGQKLQGPPTAAEVNAVLQQKGMEDRYRSVKSALCFHIYCGFKYHYLLPMWQRESFKSLMQSFVILR